MLKCATEEKKIKNKICCYRALVVQCVFLLLLLLFL